MPLWFDKPVLSEAEGLTTNGLPVRAYGHTSLRFLWCPTSQTVPGPCPRMSEQFPTIFHEIFIFSSSNSLNKAVFWAHLRKGGGRCTSRSSTSTSRV
ncbi:MAG: hypothetical protein HW403_1443 [Dehalococcoidia bacterium]|nr:hypothetical protein [Dehalococcoidia bacterium]